MQASPLLADVLQNCVSALYVLLQLVASAEEVAASEAGCGAAVGAAQALMALLQVCVCVCVCVWLV